MTVSKESYFQAVRDDAIIDVAKAISNIRSAPNFATTLEENVLHEYHLLLFDRFLDSLILAHDMNASDSIMKRMREGLDKRRGFLKNAVKKD